MNNLIPCIILAANLTYPHSEYNVDCGHIKIYESLDKGASDGQVTSNLPEDYQDLKTNKEK